MKSELNVYVWLREKRFDVIVFILYYKTLRLFGRSLDVDVKSSSNVSEWQSQLNVGSVTRQLHAFGSSLQSVFDIELATSKFLHKNVDSILSVDTQFLPLVTKWLLRIGSGPCVIDLIVTIQSRWECVWPLRSVIDSSEINLLEVRSWIRIRILNVQAGHVNTSKIWLVFGCTYVL